MEDVFVYPLKNSNEYKEIINSICERKGALQLNGLLDMQKPHITYSIFKELARPTLFIANSDLEAKKVYNELCFYTKDKVEYLGSDEIYFYHLDAKDRNEEAKKLRVLLKLAKKQKTIVVTSVDAILRKYIPKNVLLDNIYTYKIGDIIDLEELSQKLVRLGYERVSRIEGLGQFSIRGGIIDIYSLEYTNPIRIELFDDEIDSIRTFDVFSQKSIEKIKKVVITPSREFIYPEDTTSAVEKIQLETNQYTDDDVFNNIENIAQKTYFQGVENYIDYLYEENNKSIFNYLPDNAIVVINDISRLKERCENFVIASEGFLHSDTSNERTIKDNEELINWLNHNITDFMVTVTSQELRGDVSEYIGKLFHVISDLERIGDHAVNILERTEYAIENELGFTEQGLKEFDKIYQTDLELFDRAIGAFVNKKLPDEEEHQLHFLEDEIDALTLQAQDNHVERLRQKKCHTASGVVYTKLLQDLERVGDHSYNIAWAARKDKDLIRQI